MALPYKEIRNRAHQFIKDFEQPVKASDKSSTKRIDLFWRGKLI